MSRGLLINPTKEKLVSSTNREPSIIIDNLRLYDNKQLDSSNKSCIPNYLVRKSITPYTFLGYFLLRQSKIEIKKLPSDSTFNTSFHWSFASSSIIFDVLFEAIRWIAHDHYLYLTRLSAEKQKKPNTIDWFIIRSMVQLLQNRTGFFYMSKDVNSGQAPFPRHDRFINTFLTKSDCRA